MPHKYVVLGTDGFGRSDYRKALRDYFEIDAKHIVYTALYALYEMKLVSNKILLSASKELGIDTSRQHPWNI